MDNKVNFFMNSELQVYKKAPVNQRQSYKQNPFGVKFKGRALQTDIFVASSSINNNWKDSLDNKLKSVKNVAFNGYSSAKAKVNNKIDGFHQSVNNFKNSMQNRANSIKLATSMKLNQAAQPFVTFGSNIKMHANNLSEKMNKLSKMEMPTFKGKSNNKVNNNQQASLKELSVNELSEMFKAELNKVG